MPTRSLYPPSQVVLPRLDERTGLPQGYRLDLGAPWLSSTDRRLPCPPHIPIDLHSGELMVKVYKPDGSVDQLGPALIRQSSVRTPTTPGGADLDLATGHLGDLYHISTMENAFNYHFALDGPHTIRLQGIVKDIFGNSYPFDNHYEVTVARVLDLDPAELPTTPYKQGDAFAPGLHVFPPVPAQVSITVTHLPYSDPAQAWTRTITGQANRAGYFQAPVGTEIRFGAPGEFRVDIQASFQEANGDFWFGAVTWGSVVEGSTTLIEAHGRRGMDYSSNTIDDMSPWFRNQDLPANKIGLENYYPYFSGDIHWGDKTPDQTWKGDSIHTIITLKERPAANQAIYNLLQSHYPRASNVFRWPPIDTSLTGLNKRIAIGEAPLFITTASGVDPGLTPQNIDLWGYWYGSSERPDVRVREIVSEDNIGTAYWRFQDTYGYQIGEPADGDKPGDLKWEFGGIVLRQTQGDRPVREYAIYSSLWVLLPINCDAFGCARVTAPFQDATGAGINGGPIMTLKGQAIDMLFLPKGVRPGDVLEVGNTVAFSGHVGPPLDSQVSVTITSPGGVPHTRQLRANKIGWVYDPSFDFIANEPGRWQVSVTVLHDRPYIGNGVVPQSHNSGTVLGTTGTFDFYVVPTDTRPLFMVAPKPGFITWSTGEIQPVEIRGVAPAGTTAVYYTVHDKGIVMQQGSLTPAPNGLFTLLYDAKALAQVFPMVSLTAHEGRWEGLSDEVEINFLAIGSGPPRAGTVTMIGEEVFLGNQVHLVLVPIIKK
jgi:hypothetical protein